MNINILLKKIGLNDKEIDVYLALLKGGRMRPSDLAKATKISRPTVYNLAKDLISKGIITEDISGSVLLLSPLPVESLANVLTPIKKEVSEKEKVIKDAIRELGLLTADKRYPIPTIQFIEESAIETYLHNNTVKWQKAVIESDGIWWGFQDHTLIQHFESWVDFAWETQESKDANYAIQIITNTSPIEEAAQEKYPDKRRIKTIADMSFTASMYVSGDYITMISTNHHPFYLVEIHDNTLAYNLREVLKKLWNQSV